MQRTRADPASWVDHRSTHGNSLHGFSVADDVKAMIAEEEGARGTFLDYLESQNFLFLSANNVKLEKHLV